MDYWTFILRFDGFKSFSEVVDIKPKAKSVIQIWMWERPSHLDTFDPKPEAGRDYCGVYNKPIDTNVPGIKIFQALPLLASKQINILYYVE